MLRERSKTRSTGALIRVVRVMSGKVLATLSSGRLPRQNKFGRETEATRSR